MKAQVHGEFRSRPLSERLFVAVAIPSAVRDALAAAVPPEFPGRRVRPDKWHFTLQFLGDTATSARDALIAELGNTDLGPAFSATLTGLGAFPRPREARVLWVGVREGADRLKTLAAVVAAACTKVLLRCDERPYSPHLTLSRIDPPRDVRKLLATTRIPPFTTTVSEVLLMRSEIGHGPPRYTPLARFPLRAAE